LAPRKLFFGLFASAAQSRGEYPGSRTARFDKLDGCAVSLKGARLLLEGRLEGGARREAAAEGGGRRELPAFGRGGYRPGGASCGCLGWDIVGRSRGGGGGGIKEELLAAGCGGGGMRILSLITDGTGGFTDPFWICFLSGCFSVVVAVSSLSRCSVGTSSDGALDADALGVVWESSVFPPSSSSTFASSVA
jgi:hypothetical protein